MLRARHAWEGRSLELMGWMRRGGRLELILVLPDGSHLMLPAAWTDLEEPAEQSAPAGTLASLESLLAARRILDGVLGRGVLAREDDRSQLSSKETDSAVAPRSGGEPGARGGVVGASSARSSARPRW